MRELEIAANDVVLLGLPLDQNSSFLRGPALAPPRIREALHCGSANLSAENGRDLGTEPRWKDGGDLALPEGDPAVAAARIESAVAELVGQGAKVLALGGDHSVTFPIIQATAARHSALEILHFDAHPDLYDSQQGVGPHGHGCPFARIMERGLAKRLVQVGIRTLNPHQREQAARFGVEIIEMKHWTGALPRLDGPLYISIDLDAFDPAFAPGVSHHEPGGLSVREVLNLLHGLEAPVIGADIVELNPHRDPVGMTAMLAAKLVKELSAKMLG